MGLPWYKSWMVTSRMIIWICSRYGVVRAVKVVGGARVVVGFKHNRQTQKPHFYHSRAQFVVYSYFRK